MDKSAAAGGGIATPGRKGFVLRRLGSLGALLLVILLGLAARCWNHETVFGGGVAVFVDGDCYARMTRAARVMESPGLIIRHHEFENWPAGTNPHTTAPLDYLIAGLGWVCGFLPSGWRFGVSALDFAGAIIGPVLFALGSVVIFFVWPERWRGKWLVLLCFAGMPPVAWAGVLGRPDHQALLVPLLAAGAVLAVRWLEEWRLVGVGGVGEASVLAGVGAGFCAGLAFWVSLYEPVVLALSSVLAVGVGAMAGQLSASDGPRGLVKTGAWRLVARPGAGAMFPLLMLLLAERPVITMPGGTEVFDRWARQIPELTPGSVAGVMSWSGWGGLLVALGLAAGFLSGQGARKSRCAAGLAMWAILIALYFWQVRWAPYTATGLALLAPFAIENFTRVLPSWSRSGLGRRILAAGCVFSVVWEPLREWDRLIFAPEARARRMEIFSDGLALHQVSGGLRAFMAAENHSSDDSRGILAPYWLCPPLTYWSGLPCVGGTSHQSLPGIMATAEFFLSPEWPTAEAVIRSRKVRWVVSEAAERTIPTSEVLLGRAAPPNPVGSRLEKAATGKEKAPVWLRIRGRSGWFWIFEVAPHGVD